MLGVRTLFLLPTSGSETKLKGKGEVSWSRFNVIFAGFHEMERAREAVDLLLNYVWHSRVVNCGSVSFRILLIKFKFSRFKICVAVGYGPNEGNGEERDKF